MPTSSLATTRPQGPEHEAQLVSNLLRLSRVTVLVASRGSDAGTFLKSYVMPLLAAGRGTDDLDVCVFFDAWDGSPHLALLAEVRSAVASVKGSPGGIPDAVPLSLGDALTAWQEAFRVRFILVLDRFEEFLERPVDEGTLEFHRELVNLLKKPRLRINVLISIDEKADALLAPLREAVPGFGEASLRLPGPSKAVAEPNTPTAQSIEPVAAGIPLLKPVEATFSLDLAATSDAPASAAPLSAVAESAAHPVVGASPTPTVAEPRVGDDESTGTAPEVATLLPVSGPSQTDTEAKPASLALRLGWFALAAFLLFLLGLWILTPESKRAPSPKPQTSAVQPPQPPSLEPLPPSVADARAPATALAAAATPAPAASVQTPPEAPLALKGAPLTRSVEKKGPLDPPSLHIHVRDQSQRAWAETVAARLAKRGIRVSGIRLVPAGPSVMDVRYFRPQEAQEASEVARALRELGFGSPRVKHIGGYEDAASPRRYELWLGPVSGGSNQ